MADTAESKTDQVEPKTAIAAPTSPGQESKKRPLETTDDGNAPDEKVAKVQKLETDPAGMTSASAPSTTGDNKKRPRDDDDDEGAMTNKGTEAKMQKIAATAGDDDES